MTFEKWANEYFGKNVDVPEACRDAWNAATNEERETCKAASEKSVKLALAECNWTCERARTCHEYKECDGTSHFVAKVTPNAVLRGEPLAASPLENTVRAQD